MTSSTQIRTIVRAVAILLGIVLGLIEILRGSVFVGLGFIVAIVVVYGAIFAADSRARGGQEGSTKGRTPRLPSEQLGQPDNQMGTSRYLRHLGLTVMSIGLLGTVAALVANHYQPAIWIASSLLFLVGTLLLIWGIHLGRRSR